MTQKVLIHRKTKQPTTQLVRARVCVCIRDSLNIKVEFFFKSSKIIFSICRIPFHNSEDWNGFIAKIILIAKNTCFEIIQNGRKSNRVIQAWTEVFLQIFSPNNVKFIEECICTEKYVFYKKMLANGLNMSLPRLDWVEKTINVGETCWLSGKENVAGAVKNAWLVGFYGISNFVGHLTPNPFLYK